MKKWELKNSIKNVGKRLLQLITALFIIVILFALFIYYQINKDKIEYENSINNRIEQIKYFFNSEGNFEKNPCWIGRYISSWTNENILFLEDNDNFFYYYKPWQQILFNTENIVSAHLAYFEKEDLNLEWCNTTMPTDTSELSYYLDLIKLDPEWWTFLENPNNYKISNAHTYISDDYNKNHSWDYSKGWYFKITDNLILKR